MASLHTQGSASALPNVLPFPERNKGRVRNSNSINTMGVCAMSRMAAFGEAIPDNVVRIEGPKAPAPVTRSPAMLLTLCLYFEASAKVREGIKRSLSVMSYDGDPDAIALLAFLKREA